MGARVTRVLEALAVGATGAALGFGTGRLAGVLLGGGEVLGVVLAVPAGLNGVFSGARGVYAWRTPGGWLAFLLDSSWALISTTLGVAVNLINLVRRDTGFCPAFSVRANRHVFARGFALKRGFANTQGNVISNACCGRGDEPENHRNLIERHEGLHVWQQRWFGPIHPLVYVVWGALGALIATVFGMTSRRRKAHGVGIGKLVETAAYYDNPFEYWAYRNDGRWKVNSAHPALKWGAFAWTKDGAEKPDHS
jgi:hypothetical protein